MRLVSSFVLISTGLLAAVGCDDDGGGTDAGFDAGDVVADGGSRDGGGDAGTVDGGDRLVPDHYVFDSRFTPGTSSVAHTGQTARHLLIQDLKSYVGGLTADIDSGSFEPTEGAVVANLEYFFSVDGADRADDPIGLTTDPAPDQSTWGEISGARLLNKLAGNDTVTDHRDWSSEFSGWSDTSLVPGEGEGGLDSPTQFVRAIFHTLEDHAIARGLGVDRLSPVHAPEPLPVHVSANGVDLQQLLAKFLLGAVAFSQAADDYLDSDVEDKGLRSDNTASDDGAPYTTLEHAWDEAYGYFGASAFYGEYTAADLSSGPRYRDHDSSGGIDFTTEYNFGAAVNAAKRDHGAVVDTDFMGQASEAFRTGRSIITSAGGALDSDAMSALEAQRDLAIGAWEAAIAATVVHYINDVLEEMEAYGTAAFDHAAFLDLAKAWSEMKGFALMFQFNPRSVLSADDFAMVHTRFGDAPVLPEEGESAAEAYRVALRDARAILGAAYGFDAANLGDDVGAGGW